VIVWICKIW